MKKKILIAVLAIALTVGIASAAVISYFGQVKITATVTQAVLLDGKDYTEMPIVEDVIVAGGESFCRPHYLESQTGVAVELQFETTFSPVLIGSEIVVTYLKPLGYSWSGAIGGQPVNIDVEDGECNVTWTIDFPIDDDPSNGLMAVGLIIALDGEGEGPAFQIHNNDGTDSNYNWGTWLYSPWGPTIGDGWFGWHSSSINTPVSELDWVECTGGRYHFGKEDDPRPNPEGIFTITIGKCKLGEDFHWALYTAIDSGFSTYTYQQATYPEAFNWAEPVVTATNYEYAQLMDELTSPFTLQPMQHLDFIICYSFAPLIKPGTYFIYSTVKPAP